jgi:hypothetical protein
MACLVEMTGDATFGAGAPRLAPARVLYCRGEVWYDTLALGRKHGWRPRGTLPAEAARAAWARAGHFDGSFEPRLRPYLKEFPQDEALRLANALERALEDPAELAMLRIALDVAGAAAGGDASRHPPLSWAFLREFITFLREGPFVFAWSAG